MKKTGKAKAMRLPFGLTSKTILSDDELLVDAIFVVGALMILCGSNAAE